MNMKKYIIPLFAALLSFAAVSCTSDFVARNTNSEQATEEMLEHDNLRMGSYISQMMANVLPSYQNDGSNEYGSASYQVVQGLTGNIFSNFEAASNSGFHQTNEYNLIAAGWTKALFEDAFIRAAAPWVSLNQYRETAPVAAALGDVLKVAALHRVTDAYGPIPYTELGSGSSHLKYDSQQDVYKAMFGDLDSAIVVLNNFAGANSGTYMANYDRVFYGDMSKWVKFANTLRLRLALRVAYADDALFKEEALKSINLGSFLDEDASLHPGSGAWENPLYVIEYNFNDGDAKAGATIITYMNGYNDPRRSSYFTIGSDGDYHGVRMGASINDDYPKSTLWSKINCSNNDPLMIMSGAESYFLLAEYYLRMGDEASAKGYYEAGVTASFNLWGASGADSYLAGTTTPGAYTDPVTSGNSYSTALTNVAVAWNSQSSFDGHLEQIITQKYIAIFPEGMEAWAEFRRTGYPKVIPILNNNSGGLIDTNTQIRRIIYPASEYTANGTNVAAGVELLNKEAKDGGVGDTGGTKVWWDRK